MSETKVEELRVMAKTHGRADCACHWCRAVDALADRVVEAEKDAAQYKRSFEAERQSLLSAEQINDYNIGLRDDALRAVQEQAAHATEAEQDRDRLALENERLRKAQHHALRGGSDE